MHLRMTGNLLLVPRRRRGRRRTCACASSSTTASALLFVDARRFGTGVVLLGSDALDDYFASRLGVEPLGPDFTAEALRAHGERAARQPVKAFLLNQERSPGVGNIYADEALFRARIHPLRPVGTLKRAQIEALRDAVVESLELGIDAKGASIDDFRAHRRRPRAASRTASWCTSARASRARAAAHDPEDAGGRAGDLRVRALPAAPARPASPPFELGLRSSSSVPSRSASTSSRKPPTERFADQHLREGHLAGERHQLGAPDRVLGQVHLRQYSHPAGAQERLRLAAEAARLGGVDDDLVRVRHRDQSLGSARHFKTEAVVLRSIRYGEADRVLHLYSGDRGRMGAVAKGVRRVKSRLGGRLEPLARVKLVLHEGRGDLCTVTGVDTVHAHAGPARAARSLERATAGLRRRAAAVRLDRAQPARLQPALPPARAARRRSRTPPRARRRWRSG